MVVRLGRDGNGSKATSESHKKGGTAVAEGETGKRSGTGANR